MTTIATSHQAFHIVRIEHSDTHTFELLEDGAVCISLSDGPLPPMLAATKGIANYTVLNADDLAALQRLLS